MNKSRSSNVLVFKCYLNTGQISEVFNGIQIPDSEMFCNTIIPVLECGSSMKMTAFPKSTQKSDHSPPTRHSQIPYALKPVLSSQTTSRSTQLKAMENIDTAAIFQSLYLASDNCMLSLRSLLF